MEVYEKYEGRDCVLWTKQGFKLIGYVKIIDEELISVTHPYKDLPPATVRKDAIQSIVVRENSRRGYQ